MLMFACAHLHVCWLHRWKIQLVNEPKGLDSRQVSVCGRQDLTMAMAFGGVVCASPQVSRRKR